MDLEALGLRSPLVAFVAQDPGQTLLLVARGLVLFAAIVSVRGRTTRGAVAVTIAGVLLLLSLAARGLFLVDLIATAAIAIVCARAAPRRLALSVALLVAVALVIPALPVPAAAPAHAPTTAPEAVAYWRARGNLYRAHAAAFAWAIGETTPAEGYLTLASIDWELGDRDRARRVLSKVLTKATSDDVRTRARELDSQWIP
ncbi:MAG TPA: hypothetical protein VMI75_09910 [Polyangiaceae bacterium]|nr:hypothetical protein [Polyangiaceae bacterium]